MSAFNPTDFEAADIELRPASKPKPWDGVGIAALVWAAAFGGLAVVLALTLQ